MTFAPLVLSVYRVSSTTTEFSLLQLLNKGHFPQRVKTLGFFSWLHAISVYPCETSEDLLQDHRAGNSDN